jgi:hypothetical protein
MHHVVAPPRNLHYGRRPKNSQPRRNSVSPNRILPDTSTLAPKGVVAIGLAESGCVPMLPVSSRSSGRKPGQIRDKSRHRSSAEEALLPMLVMLVVLGGVVSEANDGGLLPRPTRRHRKAREDSGLPDDAELVTLARAYLGYASAAWPGQFTAKVAANPGDALIAEMVGQFKERHRSGKVDPASLSRHLKAGLRIAISYPRYSDPNSQPKSIPDQLREIIRCAKSRDLFTPWELLLADYARRATWGHRQGYDNLVKLVRSRELSISAVVVDDFDRASRNDLEAWKLAGMCKMLKVGLYGASDGFHIDDPD